MKVVSVIVLAYRSADTIVETMESVKRQTYDDIELIITDDCSPDNTVQVVREWMETNKGTLKDIKLVTTNRNTGIPGNINRALKQTTGDYVKLIAADDFLVDEAIAEYVKFCEENSKTIPVAKVHLFVEGQSDIENVRKYCDNCYQFAQKPYNEQYRMLLKQNVIVAPSGSFYPTELIRMIGGYDEGYKWFEDYPMNLKVMHAGYRMGLIDKELVWYRITGGSITASRQKQLKKDEAKLFFNLRFWYMLQAGMIREALGQSRSWIKTALEK
jgi:alpha-1,3-rhamnosyltransferase